MIFYSIHRLSRFLLFILITLQAGRGGEQSSAKQSDLIPRDRIVTNSEMASLLDPSFVQRTETEKTLFQFTQHLTTRTLPFYFTSASHLHQRISYFSPHYPDTILAMKKDADEFIDRFGADAEWMMPGKDRRGKDHNPNVVRQLARQRYAESIILQYFFHREESYLRYWFDHVRDFVADVEAGKVQKGGNDIFERFYAGHRLRNWLAVHHLILNDPLYTHEEKLLVVKAFILNAANIYDQCKKFSFGNHQLVGAEALYEATMMFPEFPVMREWNRQAKKIVLEHFEKEITSGGFQVERSSHYHKLDIINYLRFYKLATLNADPLPESFSARFKDMFTAMMQVALPNKKMPLLQDVSDSIPSRFDDIADEMSVGALLYNDPTFKFYGSSTFPASYFWFFTLDEMKRYNFMVSNVPSVSSTRLAGSDFVVLRDGIDALSNYMVIDAGLARQKPDHTHGGVLGLIAMSNGHLFLPNYPVRYSDPKYKELKNSYSKNVAIVDSLVQARGWIGNAANTGFGKWAFLPAPTISSWISTPAYDYFSGSHNGFDTIGVAYHRSVFFLKGKYWIVVDYFQSSAPHTYQQIWQGEYTIDRESSKAIQQIGDHEVLILQHDRNPKARNASVAGYYPSLWFEVFGRKNYRFITMIYPRKKGEKPEPTLSYQDEGGKLSISIGKEKDTIVIQKDGVVFSSTRSVSKTK